MTIWNGLFWKDVAERVIATVVQVLIALFTVDGFNLANVDWQATLIAAATAAILVVLKSVAANVLVSNNTVSPASLARDDRGV